MIGLTKKISMSTAPDSIIHRSGLRRLRHFFSLVLCLYAMVGISPAPTVSSSSGGTTENEKETSGKTDSAEAKSMVTRNREEQTALASIRHFSGTAQEIALRSPLRITFKPAFVSPPNTENDSRNGFGAPLLC